MEKHEGSGLSRGLAQRKGFVIYVQYRKVGRLGPYYRGRRQNSDLLLGKTLSNWRCGASSGGGEGISYEPDDDYYPQS